MRALLSLVVMVASSFGQTTFKDTASGQTTFQMTVSGAVAIGPSASGCGPPNYNCSRGDLITANFPALLASVGGLTGAGTVVNDDLSNGNRIIRISDSTFDPSRANFELITTASGSGDENLFSRMVARGGHNHYLTCIQNSGTRTYVDDFDATAYTTSRPYSSSFSSTGGITIGSNGCNWGWADNKAYVMSNSLLTSWDFTDWLSGPQTTPPSAVNVFDYTETTAGLPNFGAGNCFPAGYSSLTWESDAGHSIDGTVYGVAASITGVQGTGFKVAAYKVGSGCSVLDTSAWTVAGDWGTTGSVPSPPATFFIHNVKLSKDGSRMIIACNGTCPAGAPYEWQIGTLNVTSLSQGHGGGHWTEGYSTWVNGTNSPACQITRRPLASPASYADIFNTSTQISATAGYPCDWHAGWNNVDASDTYPFLAAFFQANAIFSGVVNTSGTAVTWSSGHVFSAAWTGSVEIGGAAYTISSCADSTHCTLSGSAGTQSGVTFSFSPFTYAWQSEIVSVAPLTGVTHRFTHAMQSGTDAPIFDAAQTIGSVSQDGKFFLFTSDWLGSLGSTAGASSCTTTSNCRTDDFIVELR